MVLFSLSNKIKHLSPRDARNYRWKQQQPQFYIYKTIEHQA